MFTSFTKMLPYLVDIRRTPKPLTSFRHRPKVQAFQMLKNTGQNFVGQVVYFCHFQQTHPPDERVVCVECRIFPAYSWSLLQRSYFRQVIVGISPSLAPNGQGKGKRDSFYALIAEGHFAAHAAVKFCLLRVTAGMGPRRAFVFVSRQFSNRCGSSGARNTMALLFVFVVILEIFSQCYLAESAKQLKNGCVVCGRKSQPRYFQKAKSYEKEFKCCFGIVGSHRYRGRYL